ncbi:MAG: hypothetical protein KDB71_15230 [Mycobacterium sp.]|nr:hypothetical protein [Mycobacterium sp.]
MYFDGTTLAALLSDPDTAAANAPAIAAAGPRYTSPLAVIEAAIELPELGEDELTAFLDAQKIELRDMPPGRHLVEGSMATEGSLQDRLHAACAAYYETDLFVLSAGEPVAPQTDVFVPSADVPDASLTE